MAYRIVGGTPLYGTVRAQGSKNAALPVLFAVLLTEETVVLSGVPDIGDVRKTLSLLEDIGVLIEKKEGKLFLCAKNVHPPSPYAAEIGAMRASSYLLGAGLSRFGEICISYPGGCDLGDRPLNLHKEALTLLGASWLENEGLIHVAARTLRGTRMILSFPSVGTTVNLLLAAVSAEGETEIYGYARETHVMCLIRFLRALGADILVTPQKITVKGRAPLHGCAFEIDSDEIEGATYLIGCAAAGGSVTVENLNFGALRPLFDAFARMGVSYQREESGVTVWGTRPLKSVSVVAAPYPAFPTDLHPPMAVLLGVAENGGRITDCVWHDRFAYLEELRKMGFRGKRKRNTVSVEPSPLYAAAVSATDLRGGAALVIAALCADGETALENTHYIERGYEGFLTKLSSLGASIREE